jgi:hypothetical protein
MNSFVGREVAEVRLAELVREMYCMFLKQGPTRLSSFLPCVVGTPLWRRTGRSSSRRPTFLSLVLSIPFPVPLPNPNGLTPSPGGNE